MLLSQSLNSIEALKFLHQNNYNIELTKTKLCNPAYFQFISHYKISPGCPDSSHTLSSEAKSDTLNNGHVSETKVRDSRLDSPPQDPSSKKNS